ncbi:MAG: hypothetical protein LAO06_14170 [Acidobacteriia bacterium]|nr:hypothetical protein [Terriglobia bacterium]
MHPNQPVNSTQFAADLQPPRCQHVKLSGEPCGQPARRGRRFCRFHDESSRKQPQFSLPVVEDAASLQLALNQIMRGLANDLLDYKKAALLLYGCQIASANLKRLHDEAKATTDAADKAREDSLTEMMLQQMQLQLQPPEAEPDATELDAYQNPLAPPPNLYAQSPTTTHQSPTPSYQPSPTRERFDIEACASAKTPGHQPRTTSYRLRTTN